LSKQGREYKKTVGLAVMMARANKHLKGRLSVHITLYPTNQQKRDIDNSIKAILDALQNAGVYLDDSQVDRLLIVRAEVKKGGIAIVTIKPMSEETNGKTDD
jgi:crossover junction endodeoxyribonuclease RusA